MNGSIVGRRDEGQAELIAHDLRDLREDGGTFV
jgi:hypothetical protein